MASQITFVYTPIPAQMNSGRFPDIMSKYWREKKHQGRCETEILNDKKIGRLTTDLASSKFNLKMITIMMN